MNTLDAIKVLLVTLDIESRVGGKRADKKREECKRRERSVGMRKAI